MPYNHVVIFIIVIVIASQIYADHVIRICHRQPKDELSRLKFPVSLELLFAIVIGDPIPPRLPVDRKLNSTYCRPPQLDAAPRQLTATTGPSSCQVCPLLQSQQRAAVLDR